MGLRDTSGRSIRKLHSWVQTNSLAFCAQAIEKLAVNEKLANTITVVECGDYTVEILVRRTVEKEAGHG